MLVAPNRRRWYFCGVAASYMKVGSLAEWMSNGVASNKAQWLRIYRQRLARLDSLSRDTWVATHSPISPERLHALGYITFVWNSAEHNLFSLFAAVMKLPEREAWVLCHDLGDISIGLRIRELLKFRSNDEALNECINNVLDVYEACRINRNLLTHFVIVAGGSTELSLYKGSRKPSDKSSQAIADSLWDLRRVGREIRSLNRRLQLLWCMYDGPPSERGPSPSKLPVPRSLWTPPPQAPRTPKHQPRSSPPSPART